jgi:hypothetical protein
MNNAVIELIDASSLAIHLQASCPRASGASSRLCPAGKTGADAGGAKLPNGRPAPILPILAELAGMFCGFRLTSGICATAHPSRSAAATEVLRRGGQATDVQTKLPPEGGGFRRRSKYVSEWKWQQSGRIANARPPGSRTGPVWWGSARPWAVLYDRPAEPASKDAFICGSGFGQRAVARGGGSGRQGAAASRLCSPAGRRARQ